MIPTLTFNDFDNYVAHLHQKTCATTNLDVGVTIGKVNDHGISGVTYSAIATTFFKSDGYIAHWQIPLLSTDSMSIRFEKDTNPERTTRQRIQDNLDKVRKHFTENNIETEPGIWTTRAEVAS